MLDMKWIALICLVFQNSGLAITMRYTFLISANPSDRYIASTAVVFAEVLKLIISVICTYYFDAEKNWMATYDILHQECVVNYQDFLKLTVPAVLYTIQNSLQYFSMSCLSAPVFQVLSQAKIITTAFFSVLLLSKKLSNLQWISVLSLAIGVALVQLSQGNDKGDDKVNSIAGLLSVVLSCLTSGFAGVYFEMVLKSSKASLWIRNFQMAAIGILIGTMSMWYRDGEKIQEKGLLVGYNHWVYLVIILQVAGGLLVAMVVKYADNVLKGFATSISILLSALVSFFFFHDIVINYPFVFGGLIVLLSVYLYGYTPPANKSTT